MKKAKKIIAIALCLLIFVFACPAVSATSTPKIILTNESAMPGKEVTVDISITGNPGIMAMTFSVVYDQNQFEYISFSKGYISTPQHKNHADKGYVVFSVCETSNKSNSGNIMSVTFKIKDDAVPGKYPITIGNHNYEKSGKKLDNCFANSSEQYIVPTVKEGSINVETECDKTGHDFGGWSVKTEASCHNTGLETRVCAKCEKVEEKILPISHEFENEWTVDKAATPEEDGIMSRHCKKCDAVTDTIKFTYDEIGGGDGEDTSSENSSSDNTSDDDSSDDDISSEDTSSDDSLDNSSNNISGETSSDDNTTSENISSGTSTNKKPAINNTVGSKNPLSAVEGLKDYQENIKPGTENSQPEDSSDNNEESETVTTGKDYDDKASDTTDKSNKTDDEKKDNNNLLLKTILGISIAIIGGILSIGILALGVILILQRRKTEE